jgi:hypothetical protein
MYIHSNSYKYKILNIKNLPLITIYRANIVNWSNEKVLLKLNGTLYQLNFFNF